MYKREYAPIVLFVYNRINHTKQVIEALLKNKLSSQSDIFIFSDYAKNRTGISDVETVREYIRGVNGFRSVNVIERKHNYGLKRNIIEGVTEIIDKYGMVIVLEDDIMATPFFLEYMNTALAKYSDKDEVMEISASHEYMDIEGLPETFMLKKGFCHGWGTWKRAWDKYKKDESAEQVLNRFNRSTRKAFNLNNATNEFGEVIDNYLGRINTWAVFWDIAIFENDGIVLVPRENMIKNIGFDGTGEHCQADNRKQNDIAKRRVSFFPDDLSEDLVARERYYDGCMMRRPNAIHRVYYEIVREMKVLAGKILL